MSSFKLDVYSLIIMAKQNNSTGRDDLIGPLVFHSEMEALNALWSFVKGRIKAECANEFLGWAYSELQYFSNSFKDSNDCLGDPNISIEKVLITQVRASADWYFNFIGLNGNESFYDLSVTKLEPAIVSIDLDDGDSDEPNISGQIFCDGIGICMTFDGYSDCSSADNRGVPVFIEKYEGEMAVRVFGDINREDPTERISLNGARNLMRNQLASMGA